MDKRKKSFLDNPALQFISSAPGATEEGTEATTGPQQPTPRPQLVRPKRESKSKKVLLLMRPSLHARSTEIAIGLNLSFNDYVSKLLEERVAREEEK